MSNASGMPPAGWYRDPNDAGRERWWDGTSWGEHSRAEQATQTMTPPHAHSSRGGSISCPRCGSNEARTLSIVRAQGTSSGTGFSSGWVSGDGHSNGHSISMTTVTTSTTGAAASAAPPRKRYDGMVYVVLGLLLALGLGLGLGIWLLSEGAILIAGIFIFGGIIGGGAAFIKAVFQVQLDAAYNRDEYPADLARWERSWQCQRCGDVFVV